jgi:hypothetical protein
MIPQVATMMIHLLVLHILHKIRCTISIWQSIPEFPNRIPQARCPAIVAASIA